MYDKELVLNSLHNIRTAICAIIERAEPIHEADDFALTPGGMLRLDAICMNLIAVGEAVKGLDKLTHGELLPLYPQIYWNGVMRMRDKIAHHYFEVDADVVYNTIVENIPPMDNVIEKMIQDLQ